MQNIAQLTEICAGEKKLAAIEEEIQELVR